ncbi:MAG: hypothetical protein QN155_06125 [Armatimonadota bacterium]|nr:hypothetical protein [Armatimonadota bacterium]MDR7403086.1 hypothetical protein [Armatimonadota bacterium]
MAVTAQQIRITREDDGTRRAEVALAGDQALPADVVLQAAERLRAALRAVGVTRVSITVAPPEE